MHSAFQTDDDKLGRFLRFYGRTRKLKYLTGCVLYVLCIVAKSIRTLDKIFKRKIPTIRVYNKTHRHSNRTEYARNNGEDYYVVLRFLQNPSSPLMYPFLPIQFFSGAPTPSVN